MIDSSLQSLAGWLIQLPVWFFLVVLILCLIYGRR